MDLTGVSTLTLQTWQTQLLTSIFAPGRVTSLSYSQGDGGRSVSYQVQTIADSRAMLALVENELRCRGIITAPIRRRAIGVGFAGRRSGYGYGQWRPS